MMICESRHGFRQVDITDRRTKMEFTRSMKHIVDLYSQATMIRVVLDNLNTHKIAFLYESFPAEQTRDLVRGLEFHYTPKHGSWLNIAEIELAVLPNMFLSQRIPNKDRLCRAARSKSISSMQCDGHPSQMALYLTMHDVNWLTFILVFQDD